jgi:microcystin-dependent protein
MSDPFIGEIRMFGGNFAPAGWVFCAGQLMPISENDALFTLLGTTYGGDGQETFGIPDLQGRVPLHQGQGPGLPSNYVLGEQVGVESVTINNNTMPTHNHIANFATAGQVASISNAMLSKATSTQTGIRIYSTNAANTTMGPTTLAITGGSQPHNNIQPTLAISFIMSLFGLFPRPS